VFLDKKKVKRPQQNEKAKIKILARA